MKQNLRLYYGLSGFVSYFIANIINNYANKFGYKNELLRLVIFLGVFQGLYSLTRYILKKKYPIEFKRLELEASDERSMLIKGKAATYTLGLSLVLIVVVFLLPIHSIDDLKGIISGIVIFLFIFYAISIDVIKGRN